jgi:tetratricopeptide (TPR) repeat protein
MFLARWPRAAWAGVLLALAACATPQTDRLVEDRGTLPAQASVAAVPFFPQEDLYCGPASLAMVLAWSGLSATQESVASQVYTPGREGTLAADMVTAARRNGRLAVEVNKLDDVLAEIAAGHPVVVFQNLALDWFPRWHYAVAYAYDLDRKQIVLHSGRIEEHRTDLRTFERTWKRAGNWALVVLPPDELPARGEELSLLQGAAGLERVRQLDAAASAYGAIRRRWPASLGAAIGEGNVRFALGDLPGAEAALRSAVTQHPEAAAAWNNLAYVLAQRGERRAAISAAEEAVKRGGDAPTYRATLEEIRKGAN